VQKAHHVSSFIASAWSAFEYRVRSAMPHGLAPFACRERPSGFNYRRDSPEEFPSYVRAVTPVLNAVYERERFDLQQRDAHALPVERVERADRVSKYDGELGESLVMAR
jgi:hypothetical protein